MNDALDQVKTWITLRCQDCGEWETGTVFELLAFGWSLDWHGVALCRPCRNVSRETKSEHR